MAKFYAEIHYKNGTLEVVGSVSTGSPRTMEHPGDPAEVDIEAVKYNGKNIYYFLSHEDLSWLEDKVKEKLEL